MIIKPSPWDSETFYKSHHPEYAAIRNIVFQNAEHDFILVGYGLNYEHFRLGKVLFYNLGTGNKFKYLFSYTLNFWLPLLLRPSVIVGMGGPNLIPMQLASMLIRAKFIPVLIGEIRSDIRLLPRPVEGPFRAMSRASFNASYAVLAIANSIKRELLESYGVPSKKVFVYRYRISDIFNPHVPKDLRGALNPSGPIVLTVCRISAQKGLQYLVEASSAVVERIPNVKFVIRAYGSEPEYRRNLLNLIAKHNLNCNFKIVEKFSPYSEIPKYMAAADVFVLPSITEGLAVVVLEAMACGLPIIATPVGGIPDVIIDKYNGLLVKPRDVQGLQNAIIRLLTDKNERQHLSHEAISTAKRAKINEFQSLLVKLIFS
jgi:glycosyltransferase involved in cell wall biosynthesis